MKKVFAFNLAKAIRPEGMLEGAYDEGTQMWVGSDKGSASVPPPSTRTPYYYNTPVFSSSNALNPGSDYNSDTGWDAGR
jgi:hypothetical protein